MSSVLLQFRFNITLTQKQLPSVCAEVNSAAFTPRQSVFLFTEILFLFKSSEKIKKFQSIVLNIYLFMYLLFFSQPKVQKRCFICYLRKQRKALFFCLKSDLNKLGAH